MAFENSLKGSTVYVKNDNVEQAMRKFKKKIQDSGLLWTCVLANVTKNPLPNVSVKHQPQKTVGKRNYLANSYLKNYIK